MQLVEASQIRLGDLRVSAMFVGDEKVWGESFVLVRPSRIWLVDENDIQCVDVSSNTDWSVE